MLQMSWLDKIVIQKAKLVDLLLLFFNWKDWIVSGPLVVRDERLPIRPRLVVEEAILHFNGMLLDVVLLHLAEVCVESQLREESA